MEVWKDIIGYEESYQISNYGNVKSKLRDISRIDKRGFSYSYKRGGKNLKNVCHKNGYAKVSLLKNGIAKQISVHRLVAIHFIDNPLGKTQVNHIDGNKHNPHVDNLEWVTPSENGLHAHKNGLSSVISRYGMENKRSRRVKQIMEDGTIKVWDSMMSAKRHGYDTGSICRVCKGISKHHKGSVWEYTDDEVTENTFNDNNIFFLSKTYEKKCISCNKIFTTKNINKKSCSKKCYKKLYDKRQKENK